MFAKEIENSKNIYIMKLHTAFSRVLKGLIVVLVVFFLSSAGFQDKSISGWYQQFFPNLNGSSITSITFLDSLTGFAVTNTNSSLQAYILKTTNGGDNWNINYTYTQTNVNWDFLKIGFVNSNTGFAFGWSEMFKTTNCGINWSIIINNLYADDISIINKDTMLAVFNSGLDGGVYRSTDGGITFSPLGPVGGNGQPNRIYMFDKNLGFTMSSFYMRRTTNGGFNWTVIPGETFLGIQFIDSLTGWKTYDGIKKTTNGGLNWVTQQLPNLPHSYLNTNLFIQNKDTVWMVGDQVLNAPIYKTTNGGVNWGYQRTDTSIHIYTYTFIQFVNARIGWAYSRYYNSGIHTTTGGNDTTFFTGINNNVSVSPTDYKLYQNYPNPFNAISKIIFKISKSSEIKIIVYDIMGKEVAILLNERKKPGEYSVSFNGNNLSSGIYFYTMYVNDVIIETKKMSMIK